MSKKGKSNDGWGIITAREVERIAGLARLGMSEEEIRNMAQDLENVLEHFSKIQMIDTSDILLSEDVTGLSNVMREDQVESNVLCSSEDLLDIAPDVHNGHIKVKAVFK